MLKDKIALVTGGSRGIGSSICKELAKAGAAVLINYANSKDSALKWLEEIVEGSGKEALRVLATNDIELRSNFSIVLK